MKMLLIIKGCIIGVATLVPGVSGGTMAIVLGVYDDIIHALARPKQWKENIGFLCQVALGALAGMFLFSKLLSLALHHFAFPVRYFFIGLICGGLPLLYQRTKTAISRKADYLFLLAGLLIVLVMAGKPETIIHLAGSGGLYSFFFLVLAGILVAVALILPGISGSFLLLALGMYELTLDALHNLNIPFLLPVAVGCLVGVLTTSRILEKLLRTYPRKTYLVIVGFLLGSIIQVFPGIPGGIELLYSFAALVLGYLIIPKQCVRSLSP